MDSTGREFKIEIEHCITNECIPKNVQRNGFIRQNTEHLLKYQLYEPETRQLFL